VCAAVQRPSGIERNFTRIIAGMREGRECKARILPPLYSPRAAHHPIQQEFTKNMTLSIAPLIALIAGIVILVAPKFLNYIVAIYLIAVGLLGLFGGGNLHIR
jgi:hypothetical protein